MTSPGVSPMRRSSSGFVRATCHRRPSQDRRPTTWPRWLAGSRRTETSPSAAVQDVRGAAAQRKGNRKSHRSLRRHRQRRRLSSGGPDDPHGAADGARGDPPLRGRIGRPGATERSHALAPRNGDGAQPGAVTKTRTRPAGCRRRGQTHVARGSRRGRAAHSGRTENREVARAVVLPQIF